MRPVIVIRQEIELVDGSVGIHTINQRLGFHGFVGLRQVKRKFAGQAVVVGDDEGRFAVRGQRFAGVFDEDGGLGPAPGAVRRVNFTGQGRADDFGDETGLMQQDDDKDSQGCAEGQKRPGQAGAFPPVTDHETEQRRHGGRDPVGQNARVEGPESIADENRGAHAEEIEHERALPPLAPESDGRPEGADKKYWIQQQRLEAHKFIKIVESRMPLAVETGIARHVTDGNPVVLGVPNNHGRGGDEEHEQGEPGAGVTQLPTTRGPEQEKKRPARELAHGRVFAKETETGGQADFQPIAGFAFILERPPAGHQRPHPAQDHGWIDGHENGADAEQGGGHHHHQEPESGIGADFAGKKTRQHQAQHGGKKRREKADAKGRVTKEGRAGELNEGDTGGLAII